MRAVDDGKKPVVKRRQERKVAEEEKERDLSRRYTTIYIKENTPQFSGLAIKAEGEPLFVRELEFVIPKGEISRDKSGNIWYADLKHRDFVLSIACDYFDEVQYYVNGKNTKLKGG